MPIDLNNDPEALRMREAYQLAMAKGDVAEALAIRQALAERIPGIAARAQTREEFGPARTAAIGAVDRIQRMQEGAQTLMGNPELAQEQARYRQQMTGPVQEARPGAFGVGEMAPDMIVPGGGGKRLLTRALGAGAAAGGTEYLATGGDLQGASMSALGGAIGNEAGRLAQRAVFGAPVRGVDRIDVAGAPSRDERGAMLSTARSMGIETTPAGRTGDVNRAQIEAGLSRDPFTSKPFVEMDERNQRRYNNIARRSIGLDGTDLITDEVLENRHNVLGAEFERIVGGSNTFVPSNDIWATLDDIETQAGKGFTAKSQAWKLLNKLRKKVGERGKYRLPITVSDYQQMSSDLARMARGTQDPNLERSLYAMRDALDYEFEKAFPSEGELGRVREQWRNLKNIEKSRALSSGNFRPQVMYNYLRGRHGRVIPGDELNNAAIVGHTLRSPIPNSGTPTGMAMQSYANAGPITRAIMMGGNAISDAYLATGGNLVGGMLPNVRPLPEITDILMPRVGREYGEEVSGGL